MSGSRLIGLCLAIAVLPVFTTTALAADHERITGSADFVATHLCADPIRVVSSYDEVMHTFYDN